MMREENIRSLHTATFKVWKDQDDAADQVGDIITSVLAAAEGAVAVSSEKGFIVINYKADWT